MERGEIWMANLDPTIGAEIQKVRPVLILSRLQYNALPLRLVCPLTGWQERFEGADWFVRIAPERTNGLDKPSAASVMQVRSLSVARFGHRLGKVVEEDLRRVLAALRTITGA